MYLVREHQEPIRDTTLAHAFAKIPGYHNREERDGWIKRAWQHMTALIRMGKLQWSAKRKHLDAKLIQEGLRSRALHRGLTRQAAQAAAHQLRRQALLKNPTLTLP